MQQVRLVSSKDFSVQFKSKLITVYSEISMVIKYRSPSPNVVGKLAWPHRLERHASRGVNFW
jgi:hypothetical protein